MRIGRTLPPAAAPIYLRDIFSGIRGFFSGQAELQRFESELKKYLGMKYCFLFSSGKAALAVSLSVLKDRYPERDKVIIPAYICYSVPSAVIRTGLKVIPCDLKPDSLEMNLTKLAPLLTETTLCVIAPHLFGLPAPISEIGKLCREKGIKVGLLRPITLWPFPKDIVFDMADQVKGILSVEMSAGQMIEDIMLAVKGKVPIAHYGRMGGIIHSPIEVAEVLEEKFIKG